MVLLVVFAQEVFTEITLEIPPDRVNMVCVVLGVVVFEQERRALDAIIMRLPFFSPSRPSEIDFVQSCFPNLLKIFVSHFGTKTLDINLNQMQEHLFLRGIELIRADTFFLQWFHF